MPTDLPETDENGAARQQCHPPALRPPGDSDRQTQLGCCAVQIFVETGKRADAPVGGFGPRMTAIMLSRKSCPSVMETVSTEAHLLRPGNPHRTDITTAASAIP